MRRAQRIFVASLLGLALGATEAGAVVGEARVSVRGADGSPVAGATVKLVPKDASQPEREAETDRNGVVVIPADAGLYEVEVQSADFVGGAGQVQVREGQTSEADLLVEPVRPWMVQNPGGVFGAFTVGPFFWGQWVDLDLGPENERVEISGGTSMDLGATSSGRRFESNTHGGGAELALGLPKVPLFSGLQLYPAVNVGAGAVSSEIESTLASAPGTNFVLEGSGPLVKTGADIVVANPRSGFYGEVAYDFEWLGLDFDRAPCAPQTTPAALSCNADTESTYQGHSVDGQLGYAIGPVAVHMGVGYTHSRFDNVSAVVRSFAASGPSGPTTVDVTSRVVQELERDQVEGVAGLDARFGPVFGRAEVRFDDEDAMVFVKLMWGFGFLDGFPW